MNLYDLVMRGDRMVDAGSPPARATVRKEPSGTLRVIQLEDGAGLTLRDAHRATSLRAFPTCAGWTCRASPGGSLEIVLVSQGRRHLLSRIEIPEKVAAPAPSRRWWSPRPRVTVAPPVDATATHEVRLAWPAPVPDAFDLSLTAEGGPVEISVGPLFDARQRLLPILRGNGVEVGPGANPAVHQDETRTVTYVEKLDRETWAKTYPKAALDPATASLWDGYIVDSARRLDRFADGSLDFVFSSHVLEHLVDPLSVFRAWWAKLAPGGVIAGVVPDARYTFDLRQRLTSTDELMAQYDQRLESPTDAMYERWCLDTAHGATPASLRTRDYAIHVNYFSPTVLRGLLDTVADMEGGAGGIFIESVRNGKDFGFAIFKP